MYVESQSQAQLGNKTTRISTFRGGSSSNSTCTCCPLLHAAWCILHASQNMPQLVKQETDGEGRGSEAAPLKVENIQANEARLVSFRSSRCALQVPTSSALIVTLFAHLKDTDTHTHTASTQTGSSRSSRSSSALRASSHPRAARWLVFLGGLEQLAAHLQSRLQLGLQLEHAP